MLFDFLKNISLIDEEYVKKYLPTSVERGSLETREGVILINQRKNKTKMGQVRQNFKRTWWV